MSATPDQVRLDALLDQSSPITTVMTESVTDELTRLRVLSESEASTTTRRNSWARPAIAGVASIALLGGMATAAAAATGVWSPWAKTPDASISYVLPSGVTCERRMGDVKGDDPAAIAVVEGFYRDTNIDALLAENTLAETITQIRSEENLFITDDGTAEPAGYGTEHYSADREFQAAISRIISNAITVQLTANGMDGADSNVNYAGESQCSGADR